MRSWTSSTRSSRGISSSLLVISGPSGAGKTSLVAGLLARRPDLVLSVSATTRPPRPTERDGIEYHFLSDEEFERRREAGAFLETATVHGYRYGTPKAQVTEAIAAGTTVVLEIDVQGARAVRAAMPEALLVFILPPDRATLRARLEGRRSEAPAELERRLRNAEEELEAAAAFDHRVVNDELDAAIDQVIRILDANIPDPKEHR